MRKMQPLEIDSEVRKVSPSVAVVRVSVIIGMDITIRIFRNGRTEWAKMNGEAKIFRILRWQRTLINIGWKSGIPK